MSAARRTGKTTFPGDAGRMLSHIRKGGAVILWSPWGGGYQFGPRSERWFEPYKGDRDNDVACFRFVTPGKFGGQQFADAEGNLQAGWRLAFVPLGKVWDLGR